MIDLIDDVPEWIIDRFCKAKKTPGLFLAAVVCIKDVRYYDITRKLFYYRVPLIYFAGIDVPLKCAFVYSTPEGIGVDINTEMLKKNFKVIQHII
jgi:hypothetical protein